MDGHAGQVLALRHNGTDKGIRQGAGAM
jgi:hypothetical protein